MAGPILYDKAKQKTHVLCCQAGLLDRRSQRPINFLLGLNTDSTCPTPLHLTKVMENVYSFCFVNTIERYLHETILFPYFPDLTPLKDTKIRVCK